ncbi:MAG TPA: glycosyltransferase family 39 protein [Gaiellaceae bacterium]|nr:glycosyltransferase family 39 protein [Gaiellaceae bacterium]
MEHGDRELARPGRLRDPYLLAVCAFCVLLDGAIFAVDFLDRTPPFFDPVEHFLDGIYLLHEPSRSYLLQWRAWYPFLTSVAAIPFNLAGSYSYAFTSACLGALFLSGTVAVTFLLGRELFGSRGGLLAAVLVGLYPETFGLSLTYLLDLPMTFMVALTMLFLVKCRGFRDRRYSLLAGAAAGLGSFTRYPFVVWVLLPVATVIASRFRHDLAARRASPASPGRASQTAWRWNALDGVLVALAIAVPWYLPRLEFLFGDFRVAQERNALAQGHPHPAALSAEGLLYYVRSLWHIASLPLAVAFVAFGAVYFTRRAGARLVLGSWMAGGYLGSTALFNKETRYFAAVLPAVALATAGGMEQVARLGRRRSVAMAALAAALAAYLGTQLYGCVFGISWLPQGRMVDGVVSPHERPTLFSQRQANVRRVRRHAWDPSVLVDRIREREPTGTASVRILADRVVTSALRLPIGRATLLHAAPKLVLFEQGAPADFPTDFVVVGVPYGPGSERRARAALAAANVAHATRYDEVYEERAGYPAADQTLVLFERRR